VTRQATRDTRHPPRGRLAAALCAACLATGALSANLASAEAQEPDDPSTSASTMVEAPPDPPAATVQAPPDPPAATVQAPPDPPAATVQAPPDPPAATVQAPPDPPAATVQAPPGDPSTTTDAGMADTPAPDATAAAPGAARPAPAAPAIPAAPAQRKQPVSRETRLHLPLPLAPPAGIVRPDTKRCPAAATTTSRHVASLACMPAVSMHTSGRAAGDAPRGRLAAPTREAPRSAQRMPTLANPTTSLAPPGAAPAGVPNFFVDKFRIPVFLLAIYQTAGIQYGVRWEVLAAINEIETDYGRNLNVSSAGAFGWMQFMPSTWKRYGVDANRDGRTDPFNPVDAIFAAARYLKAAGADQDLRQAIFAYNHADWYVNSVLVRARLIGGLPADLVGSLSGLTQGRFPVYATTRYADERPERRAAHLVAAGRNAKTAVASDRARRGIDILAKAGSPVIAVQDGRITAVGRSERLGRFVILADAYGNRYTYAQLAKVAERVPVAKPATQAVIKQARLFAHPARARAMRNGGARQLVERESAPAQGESLRSYVMGSSRLHERDFVLKALTRGRRVIAGTVLGRVGSLSNKLAPRMHFEIRPSGHGAARIDPKPILDGWKLLETTAIDRAHGQDALIATTGSVGQILSTSNETLARRVLSDPRIELPSCGRRDIEAGIIDRRVLATLAFLADSGLEPTVTSLHCGHSLLTTSGNVSEHATGSAVDIAKVNGIPILGHQGDGSIADVTIRRLLMLQGTMKPHQIISLMTYPGADNTLAMGDHADHIHVGFQVPALSAALHVRAQDCRSCRARTSDPSRPSPRQR
jgi:murein DD-endopeptidase MepM/ murein hydrolase activator NlpD